jgi:hypothetical protein
LTVKRLGLRVAAQGTYRTASGVRTPEPLDHHLQIRATQLVPAVAVQIRVPPAG